jgi:hypothetical protein
MEQHGLELVASTPNTGSYTAQMPANLTGNIKLKISAVGNVFYAVSPTVNVTTAPTSSTTAPTGIFAIDTKFSKLQPDYLGILSRRNLFNKL